MIFSLSFVSKTKDNGIISSVKTYTHRKEGGLISLELEWGQEQTEGILRSDLTTFTGNGTNFKTPTFAQSLCQAQLRHGVINHRNIKYIPVVNPAKSGIAFLDLGQD
jgi:hypothetical protein